MDGYVASGMLLRQSVVAIVRQWRMKTQTFSEAVFLLKSLLNPSKIYFSGYSSLLTLA